MFKKVEPYNGPNKTPKRKSPNAYESLKPAIEADKKRRKKGLPNPSCTKGKNNVTSKLRKTPR